MTTVTTMTKDKEKFGVIIGVNEALEGILDKAESIGSGMAQRFVQAYNEFVKPVKGVRYGLSRFYVIGTLKESPCPIEATLVGGFGGGGAGVFSVALKLGLNYDYRDIYFEPTPIDYDDPFICFPLLRREETWYATIRPKGYIKEPRLDLEIKDGRLEDTAQRMHELIEQLRVIE